VDKKRGKKTTAKGGKKQHKTMNNSKKGAKKNIKNLR
jgi:hypothetical protein